MTSTHTMSSLPPISAQSKSQTPITTQSKSQTPIKNRISVLQAINKLKETQYKIIEAKNKQARQKRILQASKAKQLQQQQALMMKQSIRKSFEMDKQMKYKSIQQKCTQQTKLHQLASTLRQTRQQFKQSIKSAFRQSSSQVYSEALAQRQRNEQLIKEFKKREVMLKQQNRRKISENMEKSREKVRDFKESRVGLIKRRREEDVIELERKIMQRSRYLERVNEVGESLRSMKIHSSVSRGSKEENQRPMRLLSHLSNNTNKDRIHHNDREVNFNRRSGSISVDRSYVDGDIDRNRQVQNCEQKQELSIEIKKHQL